MLRQGASLYAITGDTLQASPGPERVAYVGEGLVQAVDERGVRGNRPGLDDGEITHPRFDAVSKLLQFHHEASHTARRAAADGEAMKQAVSRAGHCALAPHTP